MPELVPGVTDNEESTRIHLCRHESEDSSHTSCVKKCYKSYLFVDLSEMQWQDYKDGYCSVSSVSWERIDVSFATHCANKEIEYLVDYFAPNKIIGFPREYTGKRKRNEVCDTCGSETKNGKRNRKVDPVMMKLMFG